MAVVLVLPILPWSWTPLLWPSLSPYVLICSTVAAQAIGVATLIGLPVFVIVLVNRRWFCRYLCPVGLLAEYTGRLRPGRVARPESSKGMAGQEPECRPRPSLRSGRATLTAGKLPPIGRWIALLTLGGAIFGYPLFLWMDPLAIFHGVFTLWHDPPGLAGQVSAIALGFVLTISLLVPGAWCLRICPLGATQELLALPRRLVRHARLQASRQPADRARRLSRRSAFSVALGAVCVGLGARWATAASGRANRDRRRLLRPPGVIDESRFVGLCIRCGNCVRACPVKIVHSDVEQDEIAGFLTPLLSFSEDYCREDCRRCTLVCPSGAIARLTLEEKLQAPIGVAKLDAPLCLLYDDRECDICAKACPYEAIKIVWDQEEYIALPQIDADKCPGCGACEVICPGTNEWDRKNSDKPIPLRKAIEVHS